MDNVRDAAAEEAKVAPGAAAATVVTERSASLSIVPAAARKAITDLSVAVTSASFPEDQIGIIGFSGEARCLHPPAAAGAHCDRLYGALRQEVSLCGGTDFSAALELAQECLFDTRPACASPGWLARMLDAILRESSDSNTSASPSPRGHDDVTKRIIMLTDGEHNGDGDPVKIAGLLQNAGVIIECIGIAGSPGEVDEAMLKRIASRDEAGKPRYCFIGDTAGLIRKYKSMANHIRPV